MASYRYAPNLPIFHRISLTTCASQRLKDSFTDVSWMSAQAPIRPEEFVDTKRESTLRFLDFLGQEITGTRGFAQISQPDVRAIRSIDSILESLAVEAYIQVLGEPWRVVPSRFFTTAGGSEAGGA